MEIPNIELEEWLEVLKPYQRDIIRDLVEKHGAEIAIEKWLLASGPTEIVNFGGEGNTKPFLDRFKEEMNKFICGHNDYKKEIKEYKVSGEKIKTIMVSGISATIGVKIGIASAIIAPIVALTLFTVGKIGVIAYCSGYKT